MNIREQIWGVKTPSKTGARSRRNGAPQPGASSKRAHVPFPAAGARGAQLSFADKKTHGGPRPGSGRKAIVVARPNVPHRARPKHHRVCPVHVTLRRAKGLPSLRVERLHRLLCQAIRDTRREGFRIVQYSVQADHVHLIVEAEDAQTLSNGMRSFAVRVAMRINRRVMGRTRGRVWGDRNHRRELTTPSEVRNVLVYVLNNHLKHGEREARARDGASTRGTTGLRSRGR